MEASYIPGELLLSHTSIAPIHAYLKVSPMKIFDAPGLNKPFEERIAAIKKWFEENSSDYAKVRAFLLWVLIGMHLPSLRQVLKMEKCKGKTHLEAELKRIEKLNGEGLMLRKPKSLYVAGRSSTLLKVKSFHDAEAVVMSYEPGKGKHKGRVGALHCKMANGTRFRVGTGYPHWITPLLQGSMSSTVLCLVIQAFGR